VEGVSEVPRWDDDAVGYAPTISEEAVAQIRHWRERAYAEGRAEGAAEQRFEYLRTLIVVPPNVMPITPMSHLLGEAVLAEVRAGERVLDMGHWERGQRHPRGQPRRSGAGRRHQPPRPGGGDDRRGVPDDEQVLPPDAPVPVTEGEDVDLLRDLGGPRLCSHPRHCQHPRTARRAVSTSGVFLPTWRNSYTWR
jgi:hypothetical protein